MLKTVRNIAKRSINVQWNPDFSNIQRKRKVVRKIGEFKKLAVELQCLTGERGMTVGSSCREVRKNEGSRN